MKMNQPKKKVGPKPKSKSEKKVQQYYMVKGKHSDKADKAVKQLIADKYND